MHRPRARWIVLALCTAVVAACAAPEPILPSWVPERVPVTWLPNTAPVARTPPTPSVPVVPLPQRVSLSMQRAPLGQVLQALAQSIDMALDDRVMSDAPVSLQAEDQPLDSVLRLLAERVPFRHRVESGVLIIDADVAYLHAYRVPYLAVARSLSSQMALATQVASLSTGVNTGGGNNNSSSQVSSSASLDLWSTLEAGITLIPDTQVVVQRESGLVLVSATQRRHRQVEALLHTLRASIRQQVMLEVAVVEVVLEQAWQRGVDWRLLLEGAQSLSLSQGQQAGETSVDALPSAVLTGRLSGSDGSFDWALRMLDRFGRVQVLSQPRLRVMQQQPALLKVVDNRVYFTVDLERRLNAEGEVSEEAYETHIHTVPVGLIMQIVPAIDEDGQVMLTLRPTVTRILGYREDPNPLLLGNSAVSNLIPELQVRELETVLQVQDGELALIGGLIQQSYNQGREGLPQSTWLQSRERGSQRSELWILLRATRIGSPG